VRAGPAGRPDGLRAGRAGTAGRAGGGRGDRGLGAAVLGRMGELAPRSGLDGTVTPTGLGPHSRPCVLVRPLLRPGAGTVGSSSARARRTIAGVRAGLDQTSPRGGRT